MKFYILLGLFLYINAETCSTITCDTITDQSACYQILDLNQVRPCDWDYNTQKCQKSFNYNLPCNKYLNEYNCKYRSNSCRWSGTEAPYDNYDNSKAMLANTDGTCLVLTCSSNTDEYSCSSFGDVSCDWQDGECIQINKCVDFKTVKGCRNTKFKQKCVPIVNGEVLPTNQKSTSIFDSFECVIQDCQHKSFQYDCAFVNGVQCIWSQNKCSKCADYVTYDSCVKNSGLCYWEMNQCLNIECQQYQNPDMCNKKPQQCEWNQYKMRCQLNSDLQNQQCYSEYLDQQNYVQLLPNLILIILIIIT